MKYFIFSFLLIMAAATMFAQTPADETAVILAVEKRACRAYQQGDADKISKYLTEDYTLTNAKGEISIAGDDIAEAKTGKVRYAVFENYDMTVRIYGNATAIVLGKTKIRGNSEGKPLDILVQFTDTFVKQRGQWRLAAGHVSRLK